MNDDQVVAHVPAATVMVLSVRAPNAIIGDRGGPALDVIAATDVSVFGSGSVLATVEMEDGGRYRFVFPAWRVHSVNLGEAT